MAKRRSKRKPAGPARAQHRTRPLDAGKPAQKQISPIIGTRAPLLLTATVLAGLGAVLTAYLTFTRWLGEPVAYCAAGSGCDLVQASRWSSLLGVPLSFWGFLTYLLLIALLWHLRRKAAAWARALTVAAFGTGMSVYLTTVSVLEIEATCVYCLASFAIITTITLILLFIKPPNLQRFDWGSWGIATGAGTIMVLAVMHMHFSGMFDPAAGPERPYLQALAEHLDDTGAKFFGASWCPHCQDQKALFEASADRLPYVECSPAGRGGPVATDCVNNRIESYPTWIIAGRRHEGVLTPERLAELTDFQSP